MAIKSFDTSKTDLNGKSILITGGTGSFGKMLLKAILRDHNPRRVIILPAANIIIFCCKTRFLKNM